jgi:hypothetical protein
MVSEPGLFTMAVSSSSFHLPTVPENPLGSVAEKLTRENYTLWRAQVMPPIRGKRLIGILDGTVPQPEEWLVGTKKDDKGNEVEERVLNPEFIRWLAVDQLVLQFLLNSLSREVLTQVVGMETSAQMWDALTGCTRRNLVRASCSSRCRWQEHRRRSSPSPSTSPR